jgi:nicotinamidase-related amidase
MHVCVSATARSAHENRYDVIIIGGTGNKEVVLEVNVENVVNCVDGVE